VRGLTSEVMGTVLSGATTQQAAAQLREAAERGRVFEGMLLAIENASRPILARVSAIVPYNAFYTEGDAWSEARRRGMQIPEEVARRYEIATLELLTEIPRGEVKHPPMPGAHVALLDLKGKEKEIYGVAKGDAGILWLGSLAGYPEAPVPLDIEAIPMHVAIFGVTGSGKSYDSGALIERLMTVPTGKGVLCFPMIIVDAHGDYLDYVEAAARGQGNLAGGRVTRYIFPHQFDRRADLRRDLGSKIQPLSVHLDGLGRREIAETIMEFYKGSVEGAELQVAGLDRAIEDAMELTGLSQHDLFTHKREEITRALDSQVTSKMLHDQTRKAIDRALGRFYDLEDSYHLFSKKSDFQNEVFVDEMTRKGGVAILDFSADGAPGVELPVKQFVMSFIAATLFRKFSDYKTSGQTRFMAFMIEEAQNFAPDASYPVGSSLGHSKLSAIATQGRKFGLSLILISQRPSFVDRIVLSMCNTFLIHRLSPEDVAFVRNVTGGLPASLASRLTTLDRGNLILTGQMSRVPFPLLLRITPRDRTVAHTAGKTEVLSTLTTLQGESP